MSGITRLRDKIEAAKSAVEEQPLQIQHGHDDEKVVMIFTRAVTNLKFTPDDARALIEKVQISIDMLAEHQRKRLQ